MNEEEVPPKKLLLKETIEVGMAFPEPPQHSEIQREPRNRKERRARQKEDAMTPDQREKLEQVARAWVDVNGLGRNPYSNEMVGSLANLLASRDVAVLEEVIRQAVMYSDHDDLIEWLRQQAQEQRP